MSYETPLRKQQPIATPSSGSRLRSLFHLSQQNSETPIKRNVLMSLSPLRKGSRNSFSVLSPTRINFEQQENQTPLLQDTEQFDNTVNYTGDLSSLVTSDESQSQIDDSFRAARHKEELRIKRSQQNLGYFTESLADIGSCSSSIRTKNSIVNLINNTEDDFTIYADYHSSMTDGLAEDEASESCRTSEKTSLPDNKTMYHDSTEKLVPLETDPAATKNSSLSQFRKFAPGTQHYLLTKEESDLYNKKRYGPITPQKAYLKTHEPKRDFSSSGSSGSTDSNTSLIKKTATDSLYSSGSGSLFQLEGRWNDLGDLEKFYYHKSIVTRQCSSSTALIFVLISFLVPPFWILICVGYLDNEFGRIPTKYKLISGLLAFAAAVGCAIGLGFGFSHSVG
ncbi:hypothetical protein OGAPHI_003610 [Ogataea philodendri]|uniref:Uncharacterized protein n=1 Tax=Ogataea philodendri TaxID=1378263 RepID=A0A9P8P5J4_9ASCO|nr:uncharacterized protein OGAPHI_003610 [Ogataea philodendri]KAH3665426.1 hypothetical protein OGAPHI_003610 [Ogataea philodendri]